MELIILTKSFDGKIFESNAHDMLLIQLCNPEIQRISVYEVFGEDEKRLLTEGFRGSKKESFMFKQWFNPF